MAREFSAGGVVARRMQGEWWMAAIEPRGNRSSRNPGKLKTVLALPKGLVDRGERPEQTAIREVREETGLEAALVSKLKDIKYFYVRSWGDCQRVFKVVSFYLLLYRGGKLGDISPEMQVEVSGARWLRLDEASRQLSYPGERQVAQLAQEYLTSHPEISKAECPR